MCRRQIPFTQRLDQKKEKGIMDTPKDCCDFGEFKCTVPMAINGRRQDIDICIADIVTALNAANIPTIASCCGHGKIQGNIRLVDGRELEIDNVRATKGGCYDCGLEYGGIGWIEAVIPDNIWNKISPTGDQGGILCIICIAKRLEEKGLKDIPIWLCGMEPLKAIMGDPADNMDLLRNYEK